MIRTIKQPSKCQFLVALALGMAGFVTNLLHVELLFNIDLLFGGIFIMLALQLCGFFPALLAAVIASSASWLIWNHPYSLIVFIVELAVTGLLYRRWRGNLMLADTLYWLVLGMPLAYLLHQPLMQLGYELSLAIMLKQAINGIVNVIVARMIAIWLQGIPRFNRIFPEPVGFQERISTLLALFVMATSLLLLSAESRNDMDRMLKQVVTLLSGAHRQTEKMASIVSADGSENKLVEQLTLLTQANAVFERVSFTLYDRNNVLIIASQPPTVLLSPSTGQVTTVTDLVNCWKPKKSHNLSTASRRKQTIYFTTVKTQAGSMVIQTAAASWMPVFLSSAIKTMSLILALFILTLLPGIMISKRINRALLALGESSSQLPEQIEAGQQPDWPCSSIPEIQSLITDLQLMAVALGQALSEKQGSLKRLKAESARRENLEELLIEQRQQERLRISRELHDDIGQSLQAIKLNLQVHLQECMKNSCPAKKLLLVLVSDVEKTAADLRTVVISLRQVKDSELCLSDALQSLVDRLENVFPGQIQLHCNGQPELLPVKISTALFFVAQEAIANATKHATATTVEVTLTIADKTATLLVRDNGGGGAHEHNDGAGIPIMRERALLVGGILTISSLPTDGTTIFFEVPVP